jgi:hypothetical protein
VFEEIVDSTLEELELLVLLEALLLLVAMLLGGSAVCALPEEKDEGGGTGKSGAWTGANGFTSLPSALLL